MKTNEVRRFSTIYATEGTKIKKKKIYKFALQEGTTPL